MQARKSLAFIQAGRHVRRVALRRDPSDRRHDARRKAERRGAAAQLQQAMLRRPTARERRAHPEVVYEEELVALVPLWVSNEIPKCAHICPTLQHRDRLIEEHRAVEFCPPRVGTKEPGRDLWESFSETPPVGLGFALLDGGPQVINLAPVFKRAFPMLPLCRSRRRKRQRSCQDATRLTSSSAQVDSQTPMPEREASDATTSRQKGRSTLEDSSGIRALMIQHSCRHESQRRQLTQ